MNEPPVVFEDPFSFNVAGLKQTKGGYEQIVQH